jgi:hypothetical protein
MIQPIKNENWDRIVKQSRLKFSNFRLKLLMHINALKLTNSLCKNLKLNMQEM